MVTVKDVAREAGVSTTTVSVVPNGQTKEKGITKVTYDKVMLAVRKLNYQPNLSARRLRSAENPECNIGLFWNADTRANILSRILQGVQLAKKNSEIPINIVICPFENGQLYKEKALYTLTGYNGVIIATTDKEDMDYLNDNQPMVTVVMFNRYAPDFHSIGINNSQAGRSIGCRYSL